MAKLIYSAIQSLDGFVADREGNFDWGAPDPDVHAFVNDLERSIGTHLYGRRMYEVMQSWETMSVAGQPAHIRDYAEIWRTAEKIVYSGTLDDVSSVGTRLEREFDPAVVRRMKAGASRDLSVGGSTLAAQAFRHGLVDECHLFLAPVVVGGGNPSLPTDIRVELELLDHRRFGTGVVYVRYAVGRRTVDSIPPT